MASKRELIKMTPDEVTEYLAAERKVQVATIGKNGAPHLVTMYYALHDGKVAFSTYKASQKVMNLRRNPTMTCLVESGIEYAELRGVSLTGRGVIVEDPEVRRQVGLVVGARMAGMPVPAPGEPVDPEFAAAIETAMAKRVIVVMEPEHITSWDHRKLAGAY